MRDSYDLVVKMGDKQVRPLVNLHKLVQSQLFREALTFATDHYTACGDTKFIVELVGLYHRSVPKYLLISHIRTHAQLHLIMENGEVKLRGVNEQPVTPRPPPKRSKKPATVPVVTVKKRRNPKKVDVMAPWIRMPGSYSQGKRR